MKGTFVDSTIAIDLAARIEPSCSTASAYIQENQPCSMPYYALQEILNSKVRALCNVHNYLLASENAAEAFTAVLRTHPKQGRKRESMFKELADELKVAFDQNPDGPRSEVAREMRQRLAVRAASIWADAQALQNVALTHPLGCFNSGDVDHNKVGELRGPNDSFNCLAGRRCGAAAHLSDRKEDLKKLIDALQPRKLDEAARTKNENVQRRKALKELRDRGATEFNRSRCKALGDAYFVAMCPAGHRIATTNFSDFAPLCRALGKECVKP